MTRLSLLAAAFVLVAGSATAERPASMRWARGVVTDVTSDRLTLKLRNQSLTIALDPATTVFESTPAEARPVVGDVVEAHYLDRKNVRTAVVIVHDGAAGSTELSKKPGRSYRGVTQGTKRSTLKIIVDQHQTAVGLDKHTRLVDVDGRTVATGQADVTLLLSPGEDVLVKYDERDDSMMANDVYIPGSAKFAVEVRKLKQAISKAPADVSSSR